MIVLGSLQMTACLVFLAQASVQVALVIRSMKEYVRVVLHRRSTKNIAVDMMNIHCDICECWIGFLVVNLFTSSSTLLGRESPF